MTEKRCVASVHLPGRFTSASCSKTAKVERDGKHYCTIHDPVRIKQKDAERSEKWNRQWAIDQAKWNVEPAERELLTAVLLYEGPLPPRIASGRTALLDAQAKVDALRKAP